MKYTKHFLKKIEDLFGDLDYSIRYERGTFRSGYCIVEDRKVVVINKFYDVEARINTLMEILRCIAVPKEKLSEEAKELYRELQKNLPLAG